MNPACPTCGSRLESSKKLIEGVTVLRCRPCRQFRIEGDDAVIGPCPDPLTALRRRAEAIRLARIDQEVVESDIDDPRWTKVIL